MSDHRPLAGRTILMSGGSRGIGLAIALRVAREGANIAFVAKTDKPDPRLPGTIHTAAAEITAAGGKALPIVGDVRDETSVTDAVARTVDEFGGIDVVVNNASAISLAGFGDVTAKRYDLMLDINARGTFVLISAALPHLLESRTPRVLTLSPPLNLDRRWLGAHAPYTVSKYAMTMLTLGLAEQYREQGVMANCLWPRTLIATAAVKNIIGGADGMRTARYPEIVADAAHLVLAGSDSGECFIDEDVLRAHGVTDLSGYRDDGTSEDQLTSDLFV
ncbi:SDR family oxidoreductase [Amycolatopsis sp. RTGN1]|uniref:SDR family oxidoreductase n=1 Tax=Amycolatopsis ponsaeliensis TaxID=2992142 RepID=UPI0025510BA9|nr:NAD(P)-dependent oxidoreductase [Amycolatopsis sp. RTGN1]